MKGRSPDLFLKMPIGSRERSTSPKSWSGFRAAKPRGSKFTCTESSHSCSSNSRSLNSSQTENRPSLQAESHFILAKFQKKPRDSIALLGRDIKAHPGHFGHFSDIWKQRIRRSRRIS